MDEQITLITRRVVTISDARARLAVLASGWGVVIKGRIGYYSLTVFEQYDRRTTAVARLREINRQKKAVVDSVEQILFPRTYAVGFIPEKYFQQVLKLQQRGL